MPVKLGAKDTNGCSGEKPYPLLEVATGKKVACSGPTREDALKALQVRNMAHAGIPVGQKARDWARRVFGRPSGPPKEKAEGPIRFYRDQTTGGLRLTKGLYADLVGSYEMVLRRVARAVEDGYQLFGAREKYEVNVAATFADTVVVNGPRNTTWHASWADGDAGVVLDNLREVEVKVDAPQHTEYSTGEPIQRTVRILRADAERQIVYGIVMEPADPAEISKWEGGGRTDPPPQGVDSEGDWTLEPDIEVAAHAFMQKYRAQRSAMGLQHQVEVPTVVIVESYIAPQDITLGTEVARKGSWVMGAHVTDAELWGEVKKGNLTGFSIGGRGERV